MGTKRSRQGTLGGRQGREPGAPGAASEPAAGRASVLSELRPLVPRALLDGPGWDRLLACAAELPDARSGALLGCEFRLGEREPAADLFLVLRPGSPLERHFVRRGEAAPPDSAAAALARYLVRLGQPGSELRERVAGTMLEYDLAGLPAGSPPPDPGVFLKLKLAADPDPHGGPRRLPLAALADAVGWAGGGEMRRAAERVLEALPPGARVAHVGALPGRTPRAVRLVIQDVGRGRVGGLLERLGLRGSAGPAARVLADLGDVLPRFRLDVDVTAAGLAPRVGLELHHAGSWAGARDGWRTTGRSDWRPAVERLALGGWCLEAKARGLLEWCALDRTYDRRGVFLVYKGLNHVKVTVTDAGSGAKAYAGMVCSLLRDPPRREPPGAEASSGPGG